MNLDSRISAAVDETTSAPLDLEARLGDLRTLRRRRATTRAGAALAAIAVVAAGVAITRYQPAATPQPAPAPRLVHLHGGAVLALRSGWAVTQVKGPALPGLPPAAAPRGPLMFSQDGAFLVYAAGDVVHRLDLRSGSDAEIGDCPRDCRAAYNEDLTQRAIAVEHDIVIDSVEGSGRSTRLPIGAPASGIAWSPASGSIAYTTERGGRATLEVVDVETGEIRRLVEPQAGDSLLGTPVWSPDGHQIAFVTRFGPEEKSASIGLQTVTTAGDPLVTDVHVIDRCVCSGYLPAIAWSPDGSRLLVTGPGSAPGSGGAIWSVGRDGSSWRREVAGTFGDGLAWQPPVTAQQ